MRKGLFAANLKRDGQGHGQSGVFKVNVADVTRTLTLLSACLLVVIVRSPIVTDCPRLSPIVLTISNSDA